MSLYQETVATYLVKGRSVSVDLCWSGKEPVNDPDRFYDFYDSEGVCLNLGEPWHDDGEGVPSQADVEGLVESTKKEEA